MARFLMRRAGFLVLTLLLSSLIIFVVTQLLPGDVARVILGREASEAALARLRQELGLDRSLPAQYLSWLGGFLTGEWGQSFSTQQPIRPLVVERLLNSTLLAAATLVIAVPLGILLGVVAGLNEGRSVDNIISIATLSVVGLPEFVTGLLLVQLFSFELGWLPASSGLRPGEGFTEVARKLVLPAVTATFVMLAYISRMTRASVIGELARPYVRTARLKGIASSRVAYRHVVPNAMLPTVTVIAVSVGWLISGLIVVENVFNYPGLGRLLLFAIERRDLPLLQAIALVGVVAFALSNLIADLLYARLDPRVRLE